MSRKSRAIPLLPLWAVRPVQSLSACTREHFNLYFTKFGRLVCPNHLVLLHVVTNITVGEANEGDHYENFSPPPTPDTSRFHRFYYSHHHPVLNPPQSKISVKLTHFSSTSRQTNKHTHTHTHRHTPHTHTHTHTHNEIKFHEGVYKFSQKIYDQPQIPRTGRVTLNKFHIR